jgi:SNF2 family DNA or RNA helicase
MTREQWTERYRSAKLDAATQLIQYHLEADNRAPLIMADKQPQLGNALVPAPVAKRPPLQKALPDKVVVYSTFTTHVDKIQKASRQQAIARVRQLTAERQVFSLFGIASLAYNGKTPGQSGADAIDAFRRAGPTGPRVLIVSQVGNQGLNLDCANILIILVRAPAAAPPQPLTSSRTRSGPDSNLRSSSAAYIAIPSPSLSSSIAWC